VVPQGWMLLGVEWGVELESDGATGNQSTWLYMPKLSNTGCYQPSVLDMHRAPYQASFISKPFPYRRCFASKPVLRASSLGHRRILSLDRKNMTNLVSILTTSWRKMILRRHHGCVGYTSDEMLTRSGYGISQSGHCEYEKWLVRAFSRVREMASSSSFVHEDAVDAQ
jgi:hypothetical protein